MIARDGSGTDDTVADVLTATPPDRFPLQGPDARPVPASDAGDGAALRPVWLCADDYGIAPGVNAAIRELLLLGRINATSVMVAAPSFNRGEAMALSILKKGLPRVAIGLHFTLTSPFAPLSRGYAPQKGGRFASLRATLLAALLRRLRPEKIAVEAGAQIRAFTAAFGSPPDFVDGHQHVQVFPQVREGLIAAMRRAAPGAWLRQCAGLLPARTLWPDRKGILIAALSRKMKRQAEKAGIRCNPAFAGTYDYRADAEFAALFPRFLQGLPAGGLVMCHPGKVDDELRRLDPLTDPREREFAYLAGDDFPAVLRANGVTLE